MSNAWCKRADNPSLRRPCRTRHDAAVLHLHRRFQPALNVKEHPRTVRMMADRREQKLPIDAVEEALDVEIEHPVVAPAALTSLMHGVDRRFAGPVAVGVGMEYRLQNGLQVASGDLLSDAVSDRRNTQRPRPAIRLWNLNPPYRRRKVAP